MQNLLPPLSCNDDKEIISTICRSSNWKPHETSWHQAYDNYYAQGGNPHLIQKTIFTSDVSEEQYDLYTNRRNSLDLKAIRDRTGLKSCPMCGSSMTGTLDHYLPREEFGEFSIMRANLLPACGACNSSGKGRKYMGNALERFIHPYFDTWAAQPLWQVQIQPPFRAARFIPLPLPTLTSTQTEVVAFHLKNVLGKQFQLAMDSWWATLPDVIQCWMELPQTPPDISRILNVHLKASTMEKGLNSWSTAALRGLIADREATADLSNRLAAAR